MTDENYANYLWHFNHHNKEGDLCVVTRVTVCPNSHCKEYEIKASLYHAASPYGQWQKQGDPILTWSLRPQSSAKAFPQYIPGPVLQDYEEACLIAVLSPKASATLARRCLQGMIRDFWGISKPRLVDRNRGN